MASKTTSKAKPTFILIWGGGDEPESPAITLHKTKAGALAQARENLGQVCDERSEITRAMRELRTDGHAYDLPNETWMDIEQASIGA